MSNPNLIHHVIGAGLLALAVAPPAHAEQRFEIDLGDYRFKPSTLEVTVGEPVALVLTNQDTLTPHNLKLSAPEAGLEINVDVEPGKSVTTTFTPTRAGTYDFYCDKKLLFFKSHRERGMEGKLVVKAR